MNIKTLLIIERLENNSIVWKKNSLFDLVRSFFIYNWIDFKVPWIAHGESYYRCLTLGLLLFEAIEARYN